VETGSGHNALIRWVRSFHLPEGVQTNCHFETVSNPGAEEANHPARILFTQIVEWRR
jgi:hypothetical protein